MESTDRAYLFYTFSVDKLSRIAVDALVLQTDTYDEWEIILRSTAMAKVRFITVLS